MSLIYCIPPYVLLILCIVLPVSVIVNRFAGIFDHIWFTDLRAEILWLAGLEIFTFPIFVYVSVYCSGIFAYFAPLRPFFDLYWPIPIGETSYLDVHMGPTINFIGIFIQLSALYFRE
ncbi:MAG: hypothetical protein GWO20_02815 [Candidatus Korarchaeota archaeon]|nr:hypothetical protein [Candidatus Korarchaeota archaeon]NIW12877.1 hypothetical protein [Candidatus Thorarchaeota archaeon]NIW51071.1 hypothetical protein [Candidatus Korarchaeota archaeon]